MAIERWGEVSATYITAPQAKIAQAVSDLTVGVAKGIEGDKHDGVKLSKGDRERSAFGLPKPPKAIPPAQPQKIVTASWRQITIVSEEEMLELARRLDVPLDADTMARCLCANILLRGVNRLTHIPAGSALHFSTSAGQERPNCTLVVNGPNLPCEAPGHNIMRAYDGFDPKRFEDEAKERRGLLANVFWTMGNSTAIKAADSVLVWQRGRLDREKGAGKVAAWESVARLLPESNTLSDSMRLHLAQVLLMLIDRFQPFQIARVIDGIGLIALASCTDNEKECVQSHFIVAGLPIFADELGKDVKSLYPDLGSHVDEAELRMFWYKDVLALLRLLANSKEDNLRLLEAAFHAYNQAMRAA